ncbi:hypothetical protein BKA70DRAFT_1270618 [Coprinopsis sp. MPI-PUGE-AT-0042]|nr:hypothetical protein BKA70DRAFT_1270618 [Coprinopsis sp. MPI-PUGE-AT-0042]
MQSTPLERSPAAAVGHAEDERMNRQESSERFGEGEGQGGQSYQEDVGGGALRDSHLDDRDRFEEGHDEQQAHTTPPPSQPQRRIQERTPYPDDIDDIDLDDDESDESLDTLNALLLAMRDPTQAARVRGLRSPVMTDGERSLTTGMASMGMMSMSMTEGVRGGLRVGMMGGLNRSLVNDMSHEMGEEEQDEEEEDERRSSRDGRPDVSTEEVSMVEVSMVEGNSTGERSRFVGAEWEREGYSREASSGQYSLENRRGYDRDDEGGYDSQSAHGYGHEDRYRDLGHHGRRGHHLDALEEEEEEEYESGGEDEDDGGTRPWEDEEGDGGTWRFPADDDP